MTHEINWKFIGRLDEMESIREIISLDDRSVHVVLVAGESGLGKTRLMEEVPVYCAEIDSVEYTKILDCYETFAHVPFSIESHIAESLGGFDEFEHIFSDWCRIRLLSGDMMSSFTYSTVTETFFQEYNKRARGKRIVLRFDTLEMASRSDLWERIIDLVRNVENTVILLGAQKFGAVRARLSEVAQSNNIVFHQIRLSGLNSEEVAAFIQARQEDTEVTEDVQKKVAFLTGGRPVLLTLASEWLQHSSYSEELELISVEELENLPQADIQILRQRIEKSLVHKILELTDLVDQAILQMAWLHRRFDIHILQMLFGFTSEECQGLIEKLRNLPFTRILPDGVCVLHDNIRDLVIKHNWPIVDPNGTYRVDIDNRIVNYYTTIIKSTNQRKVVLLREFMAVPNSLAVFKKWITTDTEYWIYQAECLYYTLRANRDNGADLFTTLFDEATEINRDLRGLIVSEIRDQPEDFFDRISPQKNFAIKYRLATVLADRSNTAEAYEEFLQLLDHSEATAINRFNVLIQLGNVTARLGDMPNGQLLFEEAMEQATLLGDPLLKVKGCQHLAWLCRTQGHWNQASDYYQNALSLSNDIADERSRAQCRSNIENGLAYVEYFQGHNDEAKQHCLEALHLSWSLGDTIQVGSIYATLGQVMSGQDRYSEAIQYYSQALSVFQEQRIWEGQVMVYHRMAYSAWCTRDLENAWSFLLKSRKIATEYKIWREMPLIYHILGLLVLDDYGDYEDATLYFKRGIEESENHDNGQVLLECLVALVEIAYRYLHDEKSMVEYSKRMVKEIKSRNLSYPLLEGRMQRILAQAAFDKGDFDKSLHYYLAAIPLISIHGGYGRYKLTTELLFLGSRLDELPSVVQMHWCTEMKKQWSAAGILNTSASVFTFLEERLSLI